MVDVSCIIGVHLGSGYAGMQALNCPQWSFGTFVPAVTSFPYMENFENGTGHHLASFYHDSLLGFWYGTGTLSSWAFGNPNKNVIISAASGTHAWVTGG